MTEKIKFIMPCFNLNHFAGHEYMYTKEIKRALSEGKYKGKFEISIYARSDVEKKIQKDLDCYPYYRHVEYRQDDNFFNKFVALIKREYYWYKQNKDIIKKTPNDSIIFVHSFSIYSTWQWLFLNKYIKKNNHKLKIVFRYSERLLPNFLKLPHRFICRRFDDNVEAEVFTDSEELKFEFEQFCNKTFNVLPVMAETEVVSKEFAIEKAKISKKIVTYLGAARFDKGFHLLPEVINNFCKTDSETCFLIQASIPGTKYLERECEDALEQLFILQKKFPQRIEIIDKPVDQIGYRQLLKQASILLLPYIGPTYTTQTSGILIEATTNGIPCIVPSKTWLSTQLDRTGGGTVFDANDLSSLISCLKDVINNFSKYQANAINNMETEKHKNGAKAQVKCILGD